MRIIGNSALTLFIIIAFISCTKVEVLPPEPHIEFRSFSVFDTSDILGNSYKGGRLNFYFEDGDGDIGLYPAEVSGNPDTVNLFLWLFRKENGVMNRITDTNDLMLPSPYRIPYLRRMGQNKVLKGTISVTFLYLFYNPGNNDTIRYEFFIKDRAEHYSDTVTTCEIPLSYNNTYKN